MFFSFIRCFSRHSDKISSHQHCPFYRSSPSSWSRIVSLTYKYECNLDSSPWINCGATYAMQTTFVCKLWKLQSGSSDQHPRGMGDRIILQSGPALGLGNHTFVNPPSPRPCAPPLRYWSNGLDWSFHSLHTKVVCIAYVAKLRRNGLRMRRGGVTRRQIRVKMNFMSHVKKWKVLPMMVWWAGRIEWPGRKFSQWKKNLQESRNILELAIFINMSKLLHLPTWQAGPAVRGRWIFFSGGKYTIVLDPYSIKYIDSY